jgi:hypothetical protein
LSLRSNSRSNAGLLVNLSVHSTVPLIVHDNVHLSVILDRLLSKLSNGASLTFAHNSTPAQRFFSEPNVLVESVRAFCWNG